MASTITANSGGLYFNADTSGNISLESSNVNITGNVSANNFLSTGVGVPTLTSSTNINLNAGAAVVISNSVLRLRSFTTAEIANLTPQAGRSGDLSTLVNGSNLILMGYEAGNRANGDNSIAIGPYSGKYIGSNSISIGANAGMNAQANNTIVLNASGANLTTATANTFFVKPIRNVSLGNILAYDQSTGEIGYTNYPKTVSTTVASLTAASTAGAGARAFVTDANTTTFQAVVGGSGSNAIPVYSDGTNWRAG